MRLSLTKTPQREGKQAGFPRMQEQKPAGNLLKPAGNLPKPAGKPAGNPGKPAGNPTGNLGFAGVHMVK